MLLLIVFFNCVKFGIITLVKYWQNIWFQNKKIEVNAKKHVIPYLKSCSCMLHLSVAFHTVIK